MTLGENIQKCRAAHNMSQEELAQKLFITRQTISLWETNQTVPTLENLMRLKEIFGVSVDDLLDNGKEPSSNNKNSLDTIAAALAYAMGVEPPKMAAPANYELANFIDKVFEGEKADRVVMYNPDAIAEWVYEKYPMLFRDLKKRAGIELSLATVMPSVTPVCFATMYTGAQPEVHGIQKYEKPVLTIDTLFDALIRAGKKVALVAYYGASLSRIFLDRNIDYCNFDIMAGEMHSDGIAAANAKLAELILKDEHDFILCYNGNYDAAMHKTGPESTEALAELRLNSHVFSFISEMIKTHWKHHNTLLGFAMDHGCHKIDGGCGSHGLDMPEDINIVHLYQGYPMEKK